MTRYDTKVVCLGELVYLGWMVFPLRYLFRRTVILYTHGEEISQSGGSISARLRKLYLERANAIIAVSQFCKSSIVSKYDIHPDKVFVIGNGVDLDLFQLGRGELSVLPPAAFGRKVILAVSRLVGRKGHSKLIEAMPAVLQRIPDAHCVIVGDGPLAKPLARLVSAHGLERHVSFLGSVSAEDLVRLYGCAAVFALPCLTMPDGDTEGFGLVFLEANACGVPVIAGAAGGTIEAVIDQETGIIVDGSNAEEIATALIRVLSDTGLSQRLGTAGWARVQAKGWASVTRSFLALCRDHRPSANARKPAYEPVSLPVAPGSGGDQGTPRLLVTVDVEEEFLWTEFSRTGYRVNGVEELAGFHESCRRIGLTPTYLVTFAVLQHSGFRAFLRKVMIEGSAEVGIHLHTWTTPPFWEHPNAYNSYQCNLPEHVERRKLQTLTALFTECFASPPVIQRAGRWGGSERTGRLLEEMSFKVDLSPSMGFSGQKDGAPDFSNLDGRIFWTGCDNTVLTIPATSLKYLPGPGWVSTDSLTRISRSGFGAGTPVRFSPEGQPLSRMQSMARQLVRMRAQSVVVYTLHSTSLYHRGNPYSASRQDAGRIASAATSLLGYCVDELGMEPTTCAELYSQAQLTNGDNARRAQVIREPGQLLNAAN
jgi:teichuronic acid biosynthesis glycosyltransferase TuaC